MSDTMTVDLPSGRYTIGKLPGGEALDIAFRIMEFDAEVGAAAENGHTLNQSLAIARMVTARKLREAEFRAKVFDRLLFHVTGPNGAPVMRGGDRGEWVMQFRGDDVADLLTLYQAAAKFNTERFSAVSEGCSDLLRSLQAAMEAPGKAPDLTTDSDA